MDRSTPEYIGGGVTAPMGFTAAGVPAAIKKQGRRDLALVFSEQTGEAAAVYTTNKVQAAPIRLTKEHLAGGRARAVLANSGYANACTGEQGMADARLCAELAGELLNIPPTEVIVASTGVIGMPLPMERMVAGIRQAVSSLSREGGGHAAEAIITTDTRPKEVALQFMLDGYPVKIGAMAKGAGMIHPNMATMLSFITTDLAISSQMLRQALVEIVDRTFNMLTVDGDTSTNDMVAILANGMAGNPAVTTDGPQFRQFTSALEALATSIVRMIAADGEGATKLVVVDVKGAPTCADARLAAKAVANSNLVKTAIFGTDANWGRILTAVGYSGADFDPLRVDIILASDGGIEQVARNGAGLRFDEVKAKAILEAKEITIRIDLGVGEGRACAWTCDFSYDYVRINADYRT